MKITIETEDGKTPGAEMIRPEAATDTGAAEPSAPPPEVAARAAALGALSAGPAPAEARSEGPSTFTPEPGTPETTGVDRIGARAGLSAGGAPGLMDQVEEQVGPEVESTEEEPEAD